jgi:hypothetical protein
MRGIHVSTNGFSDTLGSTNPLAQLNLVTIKEFIDTIKDLPNHNSIPNLFYICKEKMLRSLFSWNKERPDIQADGYLGYILNEHDKDIKHKVIDYLYNSLQLSNYRYLMLDSIQKLKNLQENIHYVSPNYKGLNYFLSILPKAII